MKDLVRHIENDISGKQSLNMQQAFIRQSFDGDRPVARERFHGDVDDLFNRRESRTYTDHMTARRGLKIRFGPSRAEGHHANPRMAQLGRKRN